jgi:Na+/proline symporter
MTLHAEDIVVLAVYLAVMLFMGFWSAHRTSKLADFFMPRRFGKLLLAMHGAKTSAEQNVSVVAKSFTNGISGIWYQWVWLPVTPFYWLIAPVFRRLRAITTADVFEARYSCGVAGLYSVVGMAGLLVNLALVLRASSEIFAAATGGHVSASVAIWMVAAIFAVYGVAGGLGAVILTGLLHGLLTVTFSVVLLPGLFGAVGGMDGLREKLSDPGMMSLAVPGQIGIFYIAVVSFNSLVGMVAQPHFMGIGAGRDETVCRVGAVCGAVVRRACMIPWCLTGVAAVVYLGGRNVAPDEVLGVAAADFLPRLLPGMLGIFIAAILASVLSACDGLMVWAAALFTENIYKKFAAGRSDRHYIWVGRFAAVAFVVTGIFFAVRLPDVARGLEIFWKVPAMMGIAFWLGILWRRATPAGAWASTLAACWMWWLSEQAFFVCFLERLPFAARLTLVVPGPAGPCIYLPWQMLLYIAAALAAGIAASVLSRPQPAEQTENFFALLRTPVEKGEQRSVSCTLPEDAVVPPRRNLFPRTQLEIPVPTVFGMAGFIACWIFVAALIAAFYLVVM